MDFKERDNFTLICCSGLIKNYHLPANAREGGGTEWEWWRSSEQDSRPSQSNIGGNAIGGQ